MKKIELEEENKKLLAKIEELEKQISSNWLSTDNRVLNEINYLLKSELEFYQTILMNITRKDDNNENTTY